VDKLAHRALLSIAISAFVAGVIYVFPVWAFSLVIAVFIGFSLLEFFKMVENRNIFVYKYFGTIAGALLPVVIFLGNGWPELKNLEPMLIVAASLLVFILQLSRKDNGKDHLVSMGVTIFALFYISWFFSFFVKIRLLDNGANLVLFIIMVTKGADIGAYVIGRKYGKHELIKRISPNKTKEGTAGGLLFSLLLGLFFGNVMTGLSILHSAFLGIFFGLVGQIGDLAESLLKRDCGVKDSGRHLLDMGGVLDLVDSLLFTVPLFYFYIKTL
jgi:phosphatidate cytidylyltransferase